MLVGYIKALDNGLSRENTDNEALAAAIAQAHARLKLGCIIESRRKGSACLMFKLVHACLMFKIVHQPEFQRRGVARGGYYSVPGHGARKGHVCFR